MAQKIREKKKHKKPHADLQNKTESKLKKGARPNCGGQTEGNTGDTKKEN